jgi:UDP-GlcNAc:undecaprenyl-phosphate/decaprenyl-phosphate GlcNAc-1-phosphate transferase
MPYLVGFLLAFLLSVLLTKITIRLANKYGFVDNPSRKHGAILHSQPIPRAGGVPVYLATLISALLFWDLLVNDFEANLKHLVGIFLAGLLVVVLGTLDDKYDISPKLRLICMFFCALIVVGFGIGISYVTNPLGGVFRLDELVYYFSSPFDTHSVVIFADIVALFWIVGLMNVVNWSSGLDGQNAGISVVAFLVLGLASLRIDNISEPTALLAFILSGAFLGFLLFSKYPQKIMPGFGGSTFSGFMIAVLAILSGAKFATAMIVLAIPILDAAWVFFRRIARKQNPMKNDRTHLHHYLLDIGWSKKRIAFFYWLICAILGILSLQFNSQTKMLTFILVLLLFGLGIVWLHRLSRSREH